jgi:hypothetical protein
MDNVNALALRSETTLSVKHIADRAGVGAGRSVSADDALARWRKMNVGMDPGLVKIDPDVSQ